jgi:hypothetical protein
MVEIYAALIKAGKRTLEQVPAAIYEAVAQRLREAS